MRHKKLALKSAAILAGTGLLTAGLSAPLAFAQSSSAYPSTSASSTTGAAGTSGTSSTSSGTSGTTASSSPSGATAGTSTSSAAPSPSALPKTGAGGGATSTQGELPIAPVGAALVVLAGGAVLPAARRKNA